MSYELVMSYECGDVEMWRCGNVEMWKVGSRATEVGSQEPDVRSWEVIYLRNFDTRLPL
jgi:hypothetical protein